jgi:hypothetical protein
MSLSEYQKRTLSELEGIFVQAIYNNNRQIRYPIQFKSGDRLKGTMGRNVRLDTEGIDAGELLSGQYVFGANSVYIFQALKSLIEYIEDKTDVDIYDGFKDKYNYEEDWEDEEEDY